LLGFKLILAIEEDYTFFKDDIKPISRFKCWTIRRFDFLNCHWAGTIIVISTFLMDKYVRLRAKNVSLIPVTAKVNFNKSKDSFNNPLQVLYAGTFADKDGVDDIIEGFLAFNNSYDNAELVLTGKSSQQLLYQERYRDKKNLVFRGFVEDNEFYSLLRDADVLCMCRNESGFANAGFPFKLGEYLATGNPVICTKVSDVQYYLDEKDAFLIDPGNPGQISESLVEDYK
jgi:glycosyltransferase involved in cell wall biosynthesis